MRAAQMLACLFAIGLLPNPASADAPYRSTTVVAERRPQIATTLTTVEADLAKNVFTAPDFPQSPWLSVSQGPYAGQYYLRDTMVTAEGALLGGPENRAIVRGALDFFAARIASDGDLPLWFSNPGPGLVGRYVFCPYDRTQETGGVRQVDHLLEFIAISGKLYAWDRDRAWLADIAAVADRVYAFLGRSADRYGLLDVKTSDVCGADWADLVRRHGESTYVEALWYRATLALAGMKDELDDPIAAAALRARAVTIARSVNQRLWSVSTPTNDSGAPFGHYVAWRSSDGVRDYFELDSNAAAVAFGIASLRQSNSIVEYVRRNADTLVSAVGAVRVLVGYYDGRDLANPALGYQNGGYWYNVALYLSKAYRRLGIGDGLADLLSRLEGAVERDGTLYEYYDVAGQGFHAPNYSWSLGYAIDLIAGEIAGLDPTKPDLRGAACVDPAIGDLTVTAWSDDGAAHRIDVAPGCAPLEPAPGR